MDRAGFERLMQQLADAWNAGDAVAAAACFAESVDYRDPRLYRFTRRAELVRFFDPGPAGHHVQWHRRLYDEQAQTGVLEYTYTGEHRYHGAVVVEFDEAMDRLTVEATENYQLGINPLNMPTSVVLAGDDTMEDRPPQSASWPLPGASVSTGSPAPSDGSTR